MPNHIDLSNYLVLDANLCQSPQGMVDTALAAVKGGVTVVQLRAPEWKKRKLLAAALMLKKALKGTGVPLIIDDHLDIALLSSADGIHVGQDDLPPELCRMALGDEAIIGLSVHGTAELDTVIDEVDYLGVGPVFSTATKKDASAAIGLDDLKATVEQSSRPIVAIGGIKASNAAAVMATGVDGVAVVSAICGQADPEAAARELSAIIKAAKQK